MDLFPNPGARVGKHWESVGGKVSFGFEGVSGFGIPKISSGRRRIPGFLGEGSGVLRLGLDFPVGNSQQSLSRTSPSYKTSVGNGDGLLTAEQEFRKIPAFQSWCAWMAAEQSS